MYKARHANITKTKRNEAALFRKNWHCFFYYVYFLDSVIATLILVI